MFLHTLPGCQDSDLPPVQVQGEFIAYAASEDYEVCEGTVTYAEEWTKGVAGRLGIKPEELLPMTYYFVDGEVIDKKCDGFASCARIADGRIRIYSQQPFFRHEFVHGVHASAWPRRQALLQEGLAETFQDDDVVPRYFSYSSAELDAAIEAKLSAQNDDVYRIGAHFVYWTLMRYSADEFREFWHATSSPTTSESFRATFETIFGESVDSMLGAVADEPHCPIVVCEAEPLGWDGDTWTTASPQGCGGDTVYGLFGDDIFDLRRDEVIEISQVANYEISVSESDLPGQGVLVLPCDGSCGSWVVRQGETQPIGLVPGKYRLTTYQVASDDPGVVVEIRVVD